MNAFYQQFARDAAHDHGPAPEELYGHKIGNLVEETGEYECTICMQREYIAAGELFPECVRGCGEEARWILSQAAGDSD